MIEKHLQMVNLILIELLAMVKLLVAAKCMKVPPREITVLNR